MQAFTYSHLLLQDSDTGQVIVWDCLFFRCILKCALNDLPIKCYFHYPDLFNQIDYRLTLINEDDHCSKVL